MRARRQTEALTEIESVLAGKHGPLLSASSFVVEDGGRALGATIITDWTDERTRHRQPLLAFLMVHPDASGQGLGTFLLSTSINALLAHGERELALFVTVGNSAAQRVYQKLGFAGRGGIRDGPRQSGITCFTSHIASASNWAGAAPAISRTSLAA